MSSRSLIALSVAALAALVILIGLGKWQLDRLAWKEDLIARIDARTKERPISLERAITRAGARADASYYPVRVDGRFHHDRERYLYFISLDGEPGWHVITPLETVSGRVVLIDRGFVPDALRDPATREEGQVEEVVRVTGLIRMPETPGLFTPHNDQAKNQWFSRDLSAMARSMFPGGTTEVVPFFLEARANDVPGGWPKGGQTRLSLTNNHLQYAVTWFGLALCLVGVYLAYVWQAFRSKKS